MANAFVCWKSVFFNGNVFYFPLLDFYAVAISLYTLRGVTVDCVT